MEVSVGLEINIYIRDINPPPVIKVVLCHPNIVSFPTQLF